MRRSLLSFWTLGIGVDEKNILLRLSEGTTLDESISDLKVNSSATSPELDWFVWEKLFEIVMLVGEWPRVALTLQLSILCLAILNLSLMVLDRFCILDCVTEDTDEWSTSKFNKHYQYKIAFQFKE